MSPPVSASVYIGRQDNAFEALGRALLHSGYRFTTISPESHRRYLQRRPREAGVSLRDVFGWNMPFDPALLPEDLRALAQDAGAFDLSGPLARSRVRYSTIGKCIYLHSNYPTLDANSVFFGPDTYRFVSLIEREVAMRPGIRRIVDIGCGSGAGGLSAVRVLRGLGRPARLEMTDVNPRALRCAAVNARLAGVEDAELREADLYVGMRPGADLIIANPPYLVDPGRRAYRHGGGPFGAALSERIVSEGLPMLAPGGALLLYTGTVIVDGKDLFLSSMQSMLEQAQVDFRYDEIDPDVFGEELEHPTYGGAERIAVVSLVVQAPREA